MPKKSKSLKTFDAHVKRWFNEANTTALFVFLLMAGTAMGALAFLQFTTWSVAFYIFAAIPLPVSFGFLVMKIFVPAMNRHSGDDDKVTISALVLYYFSLVIGWAMIWMIIWHIKPDSYHGIDTFDPKDAYNVFGYVLIGALFVSFRTAPTFVLPEALIACLVSGAQISVAWAIEWFLLGFVVKIIFRHFKEYIIT